jgi:hypothetical protein
MLDFWPRGLIFDKDSSQFLVRDTISRISWRRTYVLIVGILHTRQETNLSVRRGRIAGRNWWGPRHPHP